MGPSGQTVPPVSSLRRAGSLNITWPCASCGDCVGTQECYAARYRLLTLVACIFRANWPASLTPAPALPPWAVGGGGGARCARGEHVLTRRTGLSSYGRQCRRLLSKYFPPVAIVALCAQTPHGWADYASWRHATNGARPLWIPATTVARKSRLVVSCLQVIQQLAVVAARRHLAARRAT